MEVIEAIANMIGEHGIATSSIALAVGGLLWKGKSIATWLLETLRAAETVRLLQESNLELRGQLTAMQEQIEKYSELILKQTEELAVLRTRLERYEDHFAKRTATKSRRNTHE